MHVHGTVGLVSLHIQRFHIGRLSFDLNPDDSRRLTETFTNLRLNFEVMAAARPLRYEIIFRVVRIQELFEVVLLIIQMHQRVFYFGYLVPREL